MEFMYSQGEITTRDKNFNILGPAVLAKFTTQLLSKAFRRCVFFFKNRTWIYRSQMIS